jgi:Flp pilus assembly protein TadG
MRRDQTGASAIEFALVFPFLLLVVFAIVEFSMVMYDKVVITHAAREAVRAGVALASPKLNNTEIAKVAQLYCASSLLSMGPPQLANVIVNQSLDPAFQTPLEVTVSFTYRSFLMNPVFSALNSPLVLTSHAYGLNE